MEVVSLRNLKIIYFSSLRWALVIPPQCIRCIGWDLLLLVQFLILRSNISDEFITEKIGMGVWYCGVVIALLSGILSLLTVFTDPGILPPINVASLPPDEQQRVLGNGGGSPYSGGGGGGGCEIQSPNSILEQHAPAVAQYDIGMQSFCRRCQHLRPPMTAHCWWSDVCIMEMDHYCLILGVVVGGRNLRWFMLYLLATALTSVAGIYVTFNSLEAVFGQSGVKLTLFILIICAALLALVCTMFFFLKGMRLIWSGQSTRGEIKGLQSSSAALKGVAAVRHVLFPPLGSLLPLYFEELAILALTSPAEEGGGAESEAFHSRTEIGAEVSPFAPAAAASVSINGVEYPSLQR